MHQQTPLPASIRIRKAVGIDLGTTNSVIALLDPTDSTLITGQDEQGRCTFPSLVGWHVEHNRIVAGRAAAARQDKLPLASIKRFMGLPREFPLGPNQLTPPDVSACILRLLRDMMARTLNDPRRLLDAAIITMPAYFNHDQIEATRQAGELAGFEVVELLHEPTAAAIYYAWLGQHGDATYLVYDLGGGTFDVSIIRRRLDDYEVLSVSGDPFLGGDDFDRLLATHLVEEGTWTADTPSPQPLSPEAGERGLLPPSPPGGGRGVGGEGGGAAPIPLETRQRLFDLSTPAGALNFARLVRVAEGIKIELTETERVERYLPDLIRDEDGRAITLEASIERGAFHRLIRDKVDRTIDCCRDALARARERAGLTLSDIDYVILVGGSSRVPLVRDTVRAAFCNAELAEHVRNLEPLLHEPDMCVAYGAALRAATHGTRYLIPGVRSQESGVRNQESGVRSQESGVREPVLELHLTSPVNTREVMYQATGIVRMRNADSCHLTPASCLLTPGRCASVRWPPG